MIDLIKRLSVKYRELILYGIFGFGATAINIAAFWALNSLLGMHYIPSNVIAWIVAFAFAFVTNKLLVFGSKSWKSRDAIREMIGFLVARLATLVLDMFLMWVFIDKFSWNTVVSKIIVNVIVIVTNYVASKFWIFNKEN